MMHAVLQVLEFSSLTCEEYFLILKTANFSQESLKAGEVFCKEIEIRFS